LLGVLSAGFVLHQHGRSCLKAWPHSKVRGGRRRR
jgi:hypothetical protein